MMKKLSPTFTFRSLIIFVFVFLSIFITVNIADRSVSYAQGGGTGTDLEFGGQQYGGIDLVFLVDQSESMKTNDRYQMRANIIKWVMSDLGIDNLYSRKDAINRIGIVSFGSEARIDLELQSLKTTSSAELESLLKESMFPQVKADDLGKTDFIRGFEKVKEVFDGALKLENDAPRTRAIIILTDGPPYKEVWGPRAIWWREDPLLASKTNMNNSYDAYFSVLDEYIEANFPLATSNRSTTGYQIWVVGLNNKEERGQAVDQSASWGSISLRWKKIINPASDVDRVVQVPTENQTAVPPIIINILDKAMVGGVCDQRLNEIPNESGAPDGLSCLIGDEFVIPPYISQAIFSVFKPSESSTVRFLKPDGTALDMASASVKHGEAGALIDELSVDNPDPGKWRWKKMDSSPETITIHLRPIFNEIVLDDALKNIDLFDTISLRFFLRNNEGETVMESLDYPIRATAMVVFPDGSQQRFDLQSDGQGAFVSNQQIHFSQPGAYKIYISGNTINVDGKPFQLFENELIQLSVGTLEPSLAQPEDTAALYHEIPIAVELKKPDGSEPDAVSPDSIQIDGHLLLPDETTVPLALKWDAAMGAFINESPYIPAISGNYKVVVQGNMQLGDDKTVDLFPEQQLAFVVDQICPSLVNPTDDIAKDKLTKLQIQLDNCSSGPYEEDVNVPWSLVATFKKPDGTTFDLPLTKKGAGLYEAQFTPDVKGNWEVIVNSSVAKPDGATQPALDPLQYSVNVYPTTLIQLSIQKPEQGQLLKIHPTPKIFLAPESIVGKPSVTKIEIQIQDTNSKPISAVKIADNPTQAVRVEIVGPGKAAGGITASLTVSPDDPTKLIAEVPSLNEKGDYTLTASFGATRREFTPASDSPVQTDFKRTDPLAIVTPISMAVELLLLLLILFLIFRAIMIRRNPVQGMLEFEDAFGQSLGSLYLTPYHKNTFTIDQKAIRTNLDLAVSSVIKKLKIKNASSGSPQSALDDGEEYGGFGNSDASILIWGVDTNGEEFISGGDYTAGMKTLLTEGIYVKYSSE